jgi:hypothetical protein
VATKPRIAVLLIIALGALYFLLTWSSQHAVSSNREPFNGAPIERQASEEVSNSGEQPPRTAAAAEPAARESGANDQRELPAKPGRMRPNILDALGARLPPIVSPDWADEVEAKILDHIALYPNVLANSVQVQCQEDACTVLIQADHAIDPFQFEFDRFAEANGFKSAVIHTTDYNARIITLLRH